MRIDGEKLFHQLTMWRVFYCETTNVHVHQLYTFQGLGYPPHPSPIWEWGTPQLVTPPPPKDMGPVEVLWDLSDAGVMKDGSPASIYAN